MTYAILPTSTTALFRADMIPLDERIERLSGCQGQWILDLRNPQDPRGYDLHHLSSGVCRAGYGTIKDPETALRFCADHHWRGARLLFSADKLNADCSWPGGYSADSVCRSNNRVFRHNYAQELNLADGDADGLSLDLRFVTLEMLETIESLEDYPLISDDDHCSLELELQDEAWENWAAADWRRIVEGRLDDAIETNQLSLEADAVLDSVEDCGAKLYDLFRACMEQANEYWIEESGDQRIDMEAVSQALDLADLCDLTGLPLLPESQQWRREPYPWVGAESAPLIPAGDRA